MIEKVTHGRYHYLPDSAVMQLEMDRAMHAMEFSTPFDEAQSLRDYNHESMPVEGRTQWPLSAADAEKLAVFSDIIMDVERKTGLTLNSTIALAPKDSMMFGMGQRGILTVDLGAALNETTSHADTKNFLFHEAAHYRHGDVESLTPMGHVVPFVTIVSNGVEYAQTAPELFEYIITRNFSSLDEYEALLDKVSELAHDHFAPLSKVRPSFMLDTPEDILQDAYKDNVIQKTLKSLPPLETISLLSLGHNLISFPPLNATSLSSINSMIKSGIPINQENLQKSGVSESQAILLPNNHQPKRFSLGAEGEERLARIVKDKLVPLQEYVVGIKNFAQRLSLAFERRADDEMVVLSDDPRGAVRSLHKLEEVENARKAAFIPGEKPAELIINLNAHDPADKRVAGAEKLIDLMDRAKEMAAGAPINPLDLLHGDAWNNGLSRQLNTKGFAIGAC